MRELMLNNKNYALKINENVFEIHVNDAELRHAHSELLERLKAVDPESSESIIEFDKYMDGLAARMLGENALRAISGGIPVPFATKLQWIIEIIRNIDQMYFDDLIVRNE